MADMGNPFEEAEDDEENVEEDHDGGTPDDAGASPDDESAPGEETPIILGLGDAIVPGLLAVSGGQFLAPPNASAEPLIAGTILNAPALGALVGSVVGLGGLLVLLYAIERAHAGLPVLNACVILGYLGGALAAGVPIATALGL
jgi:presenilin-like A22 family membrane protease